MWDLNSQVVPTFNNIFTRTGTYSQAHLSGFVLIVLTLMVFFIGLVFLTIFYVLYTHSVVHYIGHKKARAETIIFVYSVLALLIMSGPSIGLLYSYNSQTQVGLIVKIIGSQWYWSYEISDLIGNLIPIYLLPLNELDGGGIVFYTSGGKLSTHTYGGKGTGGNRTGYIRNIEGYHSYVFVCCLDVGLYNNLLALNPLFWGNYIVFSNIEWEFNARVVIIKSGFNLDAYHYGTDHKKKDGSNDATIWNHEGFRVAGIVPSILESYTTRNYYEPNMFYPSHLRPKVVHHCTSIDPLHPFSYTIHVKLLSKEVLTQDGLNSNYAEFVASLPN